jgi:hypothetical protein
VTELNIHFADSVSSKTVRCELHKSNIHGRAAIAKPLIIESNSQMREWCLDHKTWISKNWKCVIWSDGSSFTLFPTSGTDYDWRTPKEAYNPECLLSTLKHWGGYVMVWAAISYAVGPIITLHGQITLSIILSNPCMYVTH